MTGGRGASRRRRAHGARPANRPRGRQARRPGEPIHRRVSRRLPSLRRALAAVGAAALAAGLVALLNGPWLLVHDVAWAGAHYTRSREVERVVAPATGRSILAVDTATMASALERLPAVASARVDATLPGTLHVTIAEKAPAFVWQTSAARLVGAADGTLITGIPPDAQLPDELRGLPLVEDARAMARLTTVGDVVPDELLGMARRLSELDPALLGSRAERLSVRIDDEYGFVLVSADPAWRVALGLYGRVPGATGDEAAGIRLLEQQAGAVRTLFGNEDETTIEWVDARNPGKVYFRARG